MSLGEAIGQSQKPNLYANLAAQTLARQSAKESAIEAAKRKKEEDDQKRLNVITDKDFKIDESKYHPTFLPDVKESLTNGWNSILELKRSDPNGWMNQVSPILIKMQGELANYRNQSDVANQINTDIHDGKVLADPEYVKQLNDPKYFGKLGRLKMDSSPAYGMETDPMTGFINYTPIRPPLLQKSIEEFQKDPNAWTEDPTLTKWSKVTQSGAPPNMYTENKFSVPKQDALKAKAEGLVTLNEIRAYVAGHRKIQDDFDTGKINQDDVAKMIKGEFIAGAGGAKMTSSNTAYHPPAEKKDGTENMSADSGNDRFAWNKSNNVIDRSVPIEELAMRGKTNPIVHTVFQEADKNGGLDSEGKLNEKGKKMLDEALKVAPIEKIVESYSLKDIDKGENAIQNWSVTRGGKKHEITGQLVSVDKVENKINGKSRYEAVLIGAPNKGGTKKIYRESYNELKSQIETYTVDKKNHAGSGFNLDRTSGSNSKLPVINSDEDFNKLPSGAEFIDGNGTKHKKK